MRSINREGINLFYEEVDGTRRAILLIHGWCCDHTHFAPQIKRFADLGHRIVAVDLRGHGQSDKPEQSYTMQVFADDLVWMCGQLEISKPIIVGHSMGGIVAFDLAVRYGDIPSAVVMLDAAVVLPTAARNAIATFIEDLHGPGYQSALRNYVGNALFIPTDDPSRKARILEQMSSAPRHVMISAFEGLRDYDPSEVSGGLAVPSLYIAADEPVPRSDMARFQQLAPQIQYAKTVGSGHFCQLEVPDQVNAMINRFLLVNNPVIANLAAP